MSNKNPNTDFELFAEDVYQKLANSTILKSSKVRHNVKLKGRSGCEHQIDVYWEYETNGKEHKVAIECKNYNIKVPIGKVRDFFGVLYDLSGIAGIMVSSKGFQEGAKKFAQCYGITLKSLRAPDYDEVIGTVEYRTYIDNRHCFYRIDEEWGEKNYFDVQRMRERYSIFDSSKKDYWLNSSHFPIATKDGKIRNSKGRKISSIKKLERKLPSKPNSGDFVIFAFEDAWIERKDGVKVKIKEVKFEWESSIQERISNLIAGDFVEGILNDAISGENLLVPRY